MYPIRIMMCKPAGESVHEMLEEPEAEGVGFRAQANAEQHTIIALVQDRPGVDVALTRVAKRIGEFTDCSGGAGSTSPAWPWAGQRAQGMQYCRA